MLFGEAKDNQARVIMDCMKDFSARSGLCINYAKSLIFCSPNTLCRDKKRIGDMMNIPVTDNLGSTWAFQFFKEGSQKHFQLHFRRDEKEARELEVWDPESGGEESASAIGPVHYSSLHDASLCFTGGFM